MMSRSLFFKLQKEDLKRRIWSIALSLLAFFLFLTVSCALSMDSYSYRSRRANEYNIINGELVNEQFDREWVYEQGIDFMGPTNSMVAFIMVICAIVCGLSGFFYLHSRKKVDLYHGIPVRREILFACNFINGILIFVVPYILNILACFIILEVKDLMGIEIFIATLSAFGINLLFYCMIYTLAIIAVMLTGNIIVSFMGTAVFLFYGPLIIAIKEAYHGTFFATYYSIADAEEKAMRFLSPLGSYVSIARQAANKQNISWYYGQGDATNIIVRILLSLAVTSILILSALYLYRKRPSEAAGKAMSFPISKPIIKIALVIPISLIGGILFRQLTNSSSTAWFIFGLVFTLVVVYAIIEIIYNFDIRCAFNHWKHLLICIIAVGLTACVFQFDLLHFDTYIPKKNRIESMSVSIEGFDQNVRYFEPESDYTYSINSDYYQLKYMELKDFDAAYGMAQLGISQLDKSFMEESLYYNVKYTLRGGKELYRKYRVGIKDSIGYIADIYENPAYKEAHFPIYTVDSEDIDEVRCSCILLEKSITLDRQEKHQLIELYKEELYGLTLEELSHTFPVATLSLVLNEQVARYYLYPGFDRTIAFLKEHGFDATIKMKANDVKQIYVYDIRTEMEDKKASEKYGVYTSQADDNGSLIYTKPMEIERILDSLIYTDYYYDNSMVIDVEDGINVHVIIKMDEYGNESNCSFYFVKGKIPEFVLQDLE